MDAFKQLLRFATSYYDTVLDPNHVNELLVQDADSVRDEWIDKVANALTDVVEEHERALSMQLKSALDRSV